MRVFGNKHISVVLFATILGLATACGEGDTSDTESTDDETSSKQQDQQQQGSVSQPDPSQLPDVSDEILFLFKEDADIDPVDLDGGTTRCLSLGTADTFADAVEPWPTGLRALLASELEKFPEFDLVEGAVEGIYLAKASLLTRPGSTTAGTVGGIMCDTDDDERGYVFINYDLAVTKRKNSGPLHVYQPYSGILGPHEFSSQGDITVYTMIHEIFHAIDLTYFSSDSDEYADRIEIAEMAWSDPVTSIFETVDIFAHADGDTHTHTHDCIGSHGMFLVPETPEELEAAYRHLAEETNYITPYSQANHFEDFADTLSNWYFLEIYDEKLVRTVYSSDLLSTLPADADILYTFDTAEILEESTDHREKMCAMVNLVFSDQTCE